MVRIATLQILIAIAIVAVSLIVRSPPDEIQVQWRDKPVFVNNSAPH